VATHDVRFDVIAAGFSGDDITARNGLTHQDPLVRASALRALHRMNHITAEELRTFLQDAEPEVRRTAVECAVTFPDVEVHLFLNDTDIFVAEMTAWCLGERVVSHFELDALIQATTSHPEAVVREASAAALGSIGDERGLPAILTACNDKPAVRRRAVLALAPFDGDEVRLALEHALVDRDWQVRQNAEILISPRGENHEE
jgi:HEAT repeat protein